MSDGQDELESDTTGTLDADKVHMWVKCWVQAPSVDEDGGGSIRGQGGVSVMVQGQMKRAESWLIQSASATALSSMAQWGSCALNRTLRSFRAHSSTRAALAAASMSSWSRPFQRTTRWHLDNGARRFDRPCSTRGIQSPQRLSTHTPNT